ncbi:hypothetical protein AA313_de0207158 [Arthrobotrys entomopaga]|nr:hypothetical protein AA313_de0207158 [Arthrobotrys entomopaga]
MAMTEPPAHQQPYNPTTTTASNDLDIDPVVASHVVVASPSSSSPGPSSSATPLVPAVDDLKIVAATKLDVPAPSRSPVCSASSQNGPTPPSSPSQRGAPAEQAATIMTGSSNTHSDRPTTSSSASSSSRHQRLQQQLQQQQLQPTPPSTLPEDAAFPQAAAEHSNMQDLSSSSLPPSPSNQPREPYIVEHEPHPPDTASMSSASPSSSSSDSLSTLDDEVPTLDANEASFLVRPMNDDGNHTSASLPGPPSQGGSSSNNSNFPQDGGSTTLPRIPSSSSQSSTVAELPNLLIPQHSPPVPFQPHQTGSQYSFPYVSTLDPRLTPSTRPERDNQPPQSPELPRWQPDSEVTHCPICSTSFSFFYRKHHCRKCGRVVCAPCSPHRIVIPKSYVVYPPNAMDTDLSSESYVDAAGNRRGSYVGDTGVEPISGLLDTSQRPVPAFSMPDTSRPSLPIASQFMQGNSSGSRELQTHSAPPPSFPRLKETDYCPICQTVLPPPDPVTKDETAREAHIQSCIDNTISGHSASRRRSTPGLPASLAQTTMTSQPSTSQPPLQPLAAAPLLQAHPSGSAQRSRASSRPTGGRMVVYTATAKDILPSGNDAKADDDKAECVICFEEFEEGDQIARLECFCRYHKKCITDWFNRRGDGQCPVHAMNE